MPGYSDVWEILLGVCMNNRSKIRVIPIALLCFAAGSALAAPPGPPPFGAEQNIERLTILLDLDEGQKEAVQKVLEDEQTEMKALFEANKTSETRPTREEMRAQHEERRKELQEKMQGILSDTQMKKYEALTERPEM